MFVRIALLSWLGASIAEEVCDATRPDCAADQEETGLLQTRAKVRQLSIGDQSKTELPPPICYMSNYSANNCGNASFGCYPDPACGFVAGTGKPTPLGCNAGMSGQVCRYCYKPGGLQTGLPGGVACPDLPATPTTSTPAPDNICDQCRVRPAAEVCDGECGVCPWCEWARLQQLRSEVTKHEEEKLPCMASGNWSNNVCGNAKYGCYPSLPCLGPAPPTQCNAGGVGQVCRFCYKDASQNDSSLPGGVVCPAGVEKPVTLPSLLERSEEEKPPCMASGNWSNNVCGNPTWGCFPSAACLGASAPTQCNAGGVGQVCRFCYKDASQNGSLPGGIMCPAAVTEKPEKPVTLPAF